MNSNFLEIIHKNDRFPTFQKPTTVGFYSLDENRTYHSTADNLKYLHRVHPSMKLDLNEGYSIFRERKETLENEEKIDALLSWIIANQYLRIILQPQMKRTTFIGYRGLLTTIMRTPYEAQDDWLICAAKVRNLIFLCACNTEAKKRQIREGRTMKQKMFEFWGRKFEQYMLSDHPHQKPDVTQKLDANEELGLIYRSKLNDRYILYGAEIDGVDSSEPVSTNADHLNRVKFVELKTSRHIDNERQHRNFKKYKLIKWWSQSFMVGIESVICGFRNDHGVIHQLEEFRTKDLPRLANGLWSPCVCMTFLDDFFSFVENSLKDEDDFSTWKFYWKPGNNRVNGEKAPDSNEYKILPDWFVNECTINLHG